MHISLVWLIGFCKLVCLFRPIWCVSLVYLIFSKYSIQILSKYVLLTPFHIYCYFRYVHGITTFTSQSKSNDSWIKVSQNKILHKSAEIYSIGNATLLWPSIWEPTVLAPRPSCDRINVTNVAKPRGGTRTCRDTDKCAQHTWHRTKLHTPKMKEQKMTNTTIQQKTSKPGTAQHCTLPKQENNKRTTKHDKYNYTRNKAHTCHHQQYVPLHKTKQKQKLKRHNLWLIRNPHFS